MSRDDSGREEYPDHGLLGVEDEAEVERDDPTPPEIRGRLLRDRLRERLGVTPRQWYVIESLLLALPYVVFVYVLFAYEVDETLFLLITLLYSLVAMYIGFLS